MHVPFHRLSHASPFFPCQRSIAIRYHTEASIAGLLEQLGDLFLDRTRLQGVDIHVALSAALCR